MTLVMPLIINGISSVLKKLVKYLNGTTMPTFFLLFLALSLLGNFPVIPLFYLNDAEFVIESAL